MAGIYCTADEVAEFLQLEDSAGNRLTLDETTFPRKSEVEKRIAKAEKFFDRKIGHAWTSRTVTDELYSFYPYRYFRRRGYYLGVPVSLSHRKIRNPLIEGTDYINVWNGSEWIDYIATKTEGRAKDFWFDYELGIIYFKLWPVIGENTIKLTYVYGDTSVPEEVRDVTIQKATIDLLSTEDFAGFIGEGSGIEGLKIPEKIKLWQDDINEFIASNAEFKTIVI